MNTKNTVHIVGAGVSGLIAATVLENHGFLPIILEATDRVGGRLKTDVVEGYQLDRGFQILLGAYPKAQEYLDYDALNLQKILPGAVVFKKKVKQILGDPRRETSFFIPTLSSSIPSLSDKFKVLKLYLRLKKKSLQDIFETEEKTSLAYLEDLGFSGRMIKEFFNPFFAGIFLEPDLRTSSRMFEYTFKLFAEGAAYIPLEGIRAIAKQLENRLEKTKIRFNTEVHEIKGNTIFLKNGETITSEQTIIATTASTLVSNLKNQQIPWKSCENLYFEVSNREIKKPIIGLLAERNTLINNLFYPTSLKNAKRGTQELLSVTVVKSHNLKEKELVEKILQELKDYCNIDETRFLKKYKIDQALPDIDQLRYEMAPTETQLTDHIFLAGDQLLNGSLNAAMITGERAALAVIQKTKGGIIGN